MMFVTSLSHSRIERQQRCLASWREIDLPIVAVQSVGETDPLSEHFGDVDFIETAVVGDNLGRPKCPRISELCKVASDGPIILINSDIYIDDRNSHFYDQWSQRSEDELVVGIRRDIISTSGAMHMNPWGIDAFKITPAMVPHLGDAGFCIGFPGWDYWIPWELNNHGFRVRVAESMLLHDMHDMGYERSAVSKAQNMLSEKYRMPRNVFSLFIQHATGRTGMKHNRAMKRAMR